MTVPGTAEASMGPVPVTAVLGRIAHRHLTNMMRIPATIIPILIMPIFFTISFSGAFGAIADIPFFPTDNILNWMAPFAILQGAAFAGLGASFGAGRDLETGFYDRMLVAPVRRWTLMVGPLLYSALRALLPVAIVVPIALLGGARLEGGVVGFACLVVAAAGIGIVSGLWGLGVAYRTRTQRSAALTQVGIFTVMFLSIGQVPLAVMTGWLHEAARVNPMTNVLRMARQAFLGDVSWATTWPGLVALLGATLLLGLFATTGFRRLVR